MSVHEALAMLGALDFTVWFLFIALLQRITSRPSPRLRRPVPDWATHDCRPGRVTIYLPLGERKPNGDCEGLIATVDERGNTSARRALFQWRQR
jgi:hypothetical protein